MPEWEHRSTCTSFMHTNECEVSVGFKESRETLVGALTFVKWTQQQQHMQKPTQKVSSLTHVLLDCGVHTNRHQKLLPLLNVTI